jgi:hypothetical protein
MRYAGWNHENIKSSNDDSDNGFKNQAFLKAFAGNGMGRILPDETDKKETGEWCE